MATPSSSCSGKETIVLFELVVLVFGDLHLQLHLAPELLDISRNRLHGRHEHLELRGIIGQHWGGCRASYRCDRGESETCFCAWLQSCSPDHTCPRSCSFQALSPGFPRLRPHQDLRLWTLARLREPDERDPGRAASCGGEAAPLTEQWLGKMLLLCATALLQ